MSQLIALDELVFHLIRTTVRYPHLDELLHFVSNPWTFMVPLAVVGALVLWKGGRRDRLTIGLLLVTLALSDMLSESSRNAVKRLRPLVSPLEVSTEAADGDASRWYSFPSGHATNVFAAAGFLAAQIRRRKWLRITLFLAAGLVGLSRIVVGAHYPLDVLGGIALGLACAAGGLYLQAKIHDLPSSPERRLPALRATILIVAILLGTAHRISFLLSERLPLSPEETQYWDWSRVLDWSYYSKPPLIAYLIHVSTSLFGSTAFAVRFGSVAIALMLAAIVYFWLREFLESEQLAFWSTLALGVLPLYAAGAVLMTTDAPLLLFWALTVWMLSRAIFQERRYAWFLAGLFFGLGLLSKYTMLLLAPCIALFLLSSRERRPWLRRPEPYLALLLGCLLFLPVVLWNRSHDWVGFRHVAGQAGFDQGPTVITPADFFEFLGSQVAVVTPLFFLALLWSGWRSLRRSEGVDDRLRFLFFTSVPVLLFFLAKSLHSRVQANWAAPAYFTWVPLTVALFHRRIQEIRPTRRSRLLICLAGVAFATALTARVLLHEPNVLQTFLGDRRPGLHPHARLLGWDQLGAAVTRIHREMPRPDRTFLLSHEDFVTAELAFYVQGQPRTYCVALGRRMNQYDIWGGLEEKKGWYALYVVRGRADAPAKEIASGFESITPPVIISVGRRGKIYAEFTVFGCTGFRGEFEGVPRYPDRY